MEEEKRFTGYVYKISSPHTDKVYIGSTIRTIKQRFQNHKSNYKMYMNGKYKFMTSFTVFENGDAVIEEVEKLENVTIEELHFREGYVIRNTENVVNKHIPGRTRLEYTKENTEKKKLSNKAYRGNHKDQIKQYYEDDKTNISEQRKIKMNCVCGCIFRECGIARHNKSKRHLSYIASLTPPIININIQTLNINNK